MSDNRLKGSGCIIILPEIIVEAIPELVLVVVGEVVLGDGPILVAFHLVFELRYLILGAILRSPSTMRFQIL